MSTQHRRQSHSNLIDFVSGLENIHFSSDGREIVLNKLVSLFGEPSSSSAEWTEFKIKGLDLAVTNFSELKVVITLRVSDIRGVHEILSRRLKSVGDIQKGEYGRYIEIVLTDFLYIHFFEPKKKCSTTEKN
ncbi:MAG: hypothetical protein ACP5US_05350 [Candidatus Kryptoniota bacterium]